MSDTPYTRDLLRLAADTNGAGRLPRADASATVHNPACGDRITIDLALADGRITALAHYTQACVLTQASAALLAGTAIGAGRAELEALAAGVEAMLKGAALGPLASYAVFNGVAGYPGRHVCVLLPLRAALAAISDLPEPGG